MWELIKLSEYPVWVRLVGVLWLLVSALLVTAMMFTRTKQAADARQTPTPQTINQYNAPIGNLTQFNAPIGNITQSTGLGTEQFEELKALVTNQGKQSEAESEKQKLNEKYPVGWQLFGIDRDGLVYAKEGHFTESVDLALNKVKITERSAEKIEIWFPAIKGKRGSVIGISVPMNAAGEKYSTTIRVGKPGEPEIQEAWFNGPPQIGVLGNTFIGDLTLTCEILQISPTSIVFLAGLSPNPLGTPQNLADRATRTSLDQFFHLYAAHKYQELVDKFLPLPGDEAKRTNFIAILNRTETVLGKFQSAEGGAFETKPADDGAPFTRATLTTTYEKGTAREIFVFHPTARGMVLEHYHTDRKPKLAP